MATIRSLNFRKLDAPKVVRLNSEGQLGVENIKSVITVVVTFLVDLILSINDRKYSRIIATLFGMLQYGDLIALAKLAWAEVKDTDLVESNDVVAHFAKELDLPDDKAEAVIEYAVGLVPQIYEIFLDGSDLITRVTALYQAARIRFAGDGTAEVDAARSIDLTKVLSKAA